MTEYSKQQLRFGEYKNAQLIYLSKLYKKLGKDFDFETMGMCSRKELKQLTRDAYSKLGNGGYTKNMRGIV